MTDHDPELCARVARVMGREDATVQAGCCLLLNTARTFTDEDGCTQAAVDHFRPDTDPADAWRVLEWLHAHDHREDGHQKWDALWWCKTPYLMRSLCEFVAALGDE